MRKTGRVGTQNLLRRYPALGLVAVAAILAVLLPSALNVPQTSPSTLSEFAPVPGSGEGRSDSSDLGGATSGGLGVGRGVGSASSGQPPQTGIPSQSRSRLKRCVGTPPRQTEDPLSPPCVAFFEGDNGGNTAKGVSRDEVAVTAEMSDTDPATDPNQGKVISCAEAHNAEDTFRDTLCKAYYKYFNERYQTYNRRVQLYSAHRRLNASLSAGEIDERHNPFAHVANGNSDAWSQRKILNVGYIGSSRASYQRFAPYRVTFRADDEDQMAQAGSFICSKLAGRPARYAGPGVDTASARKFGILFTAPATTTRKNLLRREILDRCGLSPQETSESQNPTGVASLRSENVTTVIVIVESTAAVTASNHATELAWFPEWVVVGAANTNGADNNANARNVNQAQWQNAFGVTYDVRRGAVTDQPWYRAYREACGTCPEPSVGQGGIFAASTYESLAMLFYGIQSAGPRLTAENVDKGLHAIPPRPSSDPFRPAAYFAPGNYSYIKDAMAIWWDSSGQPPGSNSRGCYRLPNEGGRFRAGEWTSGDSDIESPGPCQADQIQ